jgi:hypothetical protein
MLAALSFRTRICKRLRSPGIDFASLCSLASCYDNPICRTDSPCYTASNFGLMYSRKRIRQDLFPNFIYIFPKSFMIFCQELSNPKRNYENQIWTYRLPRMSSWKSNKHHTLDLNSGPLHHKHVLSTGPSKLIHNVPTKLSMSES